jgi:hypothetical protein
MLEKEVLGGKTATDLKKEGANPYNEAGNLTGASLGQGKGKASTDVDAAIRKEQVETRGKGETQ